MSVATMRLELEELQDKRRAAEKHLEDVTRQYKVGMWGILLGIPLLFFYGLGILFILAGGLAAATNASKKSSAQNRLNSLNAEISELRRKIAEMEDSQ